jgi:putative membrane-bound dehydrogenase-like protein
MTGMWRQFSQSIVPTVLLAIFAQVTDGQTIPVGVARVDISPDYPVRLHGYASRNEESKGVQQRIWAKALAIGSDDQGPSILITADVLGVTDAIAEQVAVRLKRQANIPRERIAIGASHTHSAPVVAGLAPCIFGKDVNEAERRHIDQFTSDLTEALGRVAIDALKARQPCTISWAQGTLGFAENRRIVKDGKWSAFGESLSGLVDHALPVLSATSPDGTILAILVNYACHCTTLDPNDNLISGDWAGYAQEAIERDHPGAIALTLIGCGADANPKRTGARLQDARDYGRSLADEVSRILTQPLRSLSSPPVCRFERATLPLERMPNRDDLERQIKAGGAVGYTAQTFVDRLERGDALTSALNYPVQTWQFGDDLLMVFLAGEVVVDYALRFKKELDPSRLWVVAYANDVPCYIPSERILTEGGYEGGGAMTYYGLPARLKPGVEEKIDWAVKAIAPATFMAPRSPEAGAPPPKSPQEAQASFRVKPGFRIELVASEPAIVSPVAIDWGADGTLWVCEMFDYPSGLDGRGKPGGRIKALKDQDGDGFYESATTFLEGIPFPTGVMAWRDGVLVCSAPEIFYAEDRDRDGKADFRRTLYEGFATENFQARVNGLSYHLDNWVHGANGLIGGRIRTTANGNVVDIGGRDFRIRPDSGEIEPLSGLTQQGRVHDDWGEEFGGNNSILIQHYPFPDHYARRNRHTASPSPAVYLPRDEDSTRLFPASRTPERFNHPESADRVTSACSPMIYRDSLLGPEYRDNAFACEPVHNLVHRELLSREGVTFASHRASDEHDSEFLASTDNWCRPVQVRTGPDGAIYVVDMYRYVIEHPRWISPERLEKLDVRAGDNKGRIYRVYREGTPPRKVKTLDRLDTAALVQALDDPNGTRRDQVQMRVVQRRDDAAVPVLRELARSSSRAECRMQALCTLDGLDALGADSIFDSLRDPDPRVQRNAVRLSESRLGRDAAIGPALLALTDSTDPRVRYQLALSLGEWDSADAATALAQLALSIPSDSWVRAAAISSAVKRPADVLRAALRKAANMSDRQSVIDPLVATLAATGGETDWNQGLGALLADDGTKRSSPAFTSVATLLDAGERRGWSPLSAAGRLQSAMDAAVLVAEDAHVTPGERTAAIRLLAVGLSGPGRIDRLGGLLNPHNPSEVQIAAIRGLTRSESADGFARAIASWSSLTPSARGEAVDALLARRNGIDALLDAIRRGAVPVSAVDASRRQRLVTHTDFSVRRAASELLAASVPKGRQDVLDSYRSVLSLKGDSSRGAKVFERACATCHRLNGKGQEVGPDLAGLTGSSAESLSIAILDPNRDVDARYADYLAAMSDGRVVNGLIAAETANAITLKRSDGRLDVLLRSEIEALSTSGRSLMPDGLEKDLSPTDLADLIAYVSGVSPPKTFSGNEPLRVVPGNDGSLRLSATKAAIHGRTLVFEPTFENLGFWHSEDDRAVWSFRTDKDAAFTVSMDYACANESSGNSFLIRVGDASLRGRVGGTGAGTWANYRALFVGELTLPAGEHRLELRSAGALHGALMDLTAVVLTPRTP